MSDLYQLKPFVDTLESWGLTDVLLPFLLIFTLIFAVMQKIGVLINRVECIKT